MDNTTYARKMVVVPPELIARLEQNKSTVGAAAVENNNLDSEMTRILNDKQLGDNEKWKLYQQVLQRHLHMTAAKREKNNLPIVDTEMGATQDRMQRTATALVDELVESFPKIYKSEARSLLRTMARRDDLVSWDSDGFVYVKNQKIPGSNIVDILHSIVRLRKVDPLPVGWHEVMQALKEMRIPITYICNEAALRFLGQEPGRTGTSPGSAMYSPSSSKRTPILQRLRPRPNNQGPSYIPNDLSSWEPFTTTPRSRSSSSSSSKRQ